VIEIPANAAAGNVRFVRMPSNPTVPTAVAAGYQAFERGDYAAALASYLHELQIDPNSRDSLLGAAAASTRLGRLDEARRYYQLALTRDPKDTMAAAGLASLSLDGRAEEQEERLKQLYASQPMAETASALGNLLARQGRWHEAQEYYFRAFTAAPEDADSAYNLAISLDALNEKSLAAQYYEKALKLGQTGGSFDRNAARRRLEALGKP
jgi:tetratricopeptide (TPR) repeat protein